MTSNYSLEFGLEKPLGQLRPPAKHKVCTLLTCSSEITHVLGWFSDSWAKSSCSLCFSTFTEQNAGSLEKLAQDDNEMLCLVVLSIMTTVSLIRWPSSELYDTNSAMPWMYLQLCLLVYNSVLNLGWMRRCSIPWICWSNKACDLFYKEKKQVRLCVTDFDNWMLEGALLAGVSPWGVNKRKHNIYFVQKLWWAITMETV